MAEAFEVRVEGDVVPARAYAPEAAARAPILVLGHGAGAPQASPFMVEMARDLAARGIEVVTFDFVYTAKKKKAPDRAPLLEACYRAVVGAVRGRANGKARALFLGGKSMGGRIASQIAPTEEGLAGLVFLGYPLHPPGKPEQLRSEHLPRVRAPMLFVQGSGDAFGTPAELRPILARLVNGTELFVVEGGDHSFNVPKKSGVSQVEVMTAVKDEVARWVHARARG